MLFQRLYKTAKSSKQKIYRKIYTCGCVIGTIIIIIISISFDFDLQRAEDDVRLYLLRSRSTLINIGLNSLTPLYWFYSQLLMFYHLIHMFCL